LEPVCSYRVRLHTPPEWIGPTPEGIRVNFLVAGGDVTGPRVCGTVRPVGGDWLTVRTDGVGLVDCRLTIETHDRGLLSLSYSGVVDLGTDGYQAFLQGKSPSTIPVRVASRFQTAHPSYNWLNRLQCFSIGETDLDRSEVRFDVYAIR
jgi:hypothetical protein